MDHKLKLSVVSRSSDPTRYQRLVGSLLYASINTRPDISIAVKQLSKHLLSHDATHIDAAKRVFRYIKGTISAGLLVPSNLNLTNIRIFTDADWAQDIPSRRSTTGLLFLIDNFPVDYYCREQKSVSLSTFEAEMFAISQATRVVTHYRYLLTELHVIPSNFTFPVHSDSESAIAALMQPDAKAPSKHIDIRIKYLQQKIVRKEIMLSHVRTKDNYADFLTKPLQWEIFHPLTSPYIHSVPGSTPPPTGTSLRSGDENQNNSHTGSLVLRTLT
jgi:hypothetical protein